MVPPQRYSVLSLFVIANGPNNFSGGKPKIPNERQVLSLVALLLFFPSRFQYNLGF